VVCAVLEVQGLTRPGIEPFSLRLDAGECVALGGPSGAGKTLLLRAVADLDPSVGAVSLDGVSREAMPAPEWRRRVGYLAPEAGWWADGVAAHFPDCAGALALLPALGLAVAALEWQVARLSTGERQRLALDPDTTAMVEGVLRQRLGDGAAIVLVTHAAEQARRLARRHFRIDAGRVREAGP